MNLYEGSGAAAEVCIDPLKSKQSSPCRQIMKNSRAELYAINLRIERKRRTIADTTAAD